MKMKTTLVCGLLGAGKTTFLQNLLRESHEGVVVLVNDFGEAGVDGEVFTSGGIKAVELPNGCVCCTLKAELRYSVKKIIAEFNPGHLVVEPSGMAGASGVLEALEEAGAGPVSVIGIVDASEFADLYKEEVYGPFFEDQVVNSDVLIVNKTDIAEEAKIEETIAILSSLNPHAHILRAVMGRAHLPEMAPPWRGARPLKARSVHQHSLPFETVSLGLPQNLDIPLIREVFGQMAAGQFGNVLRAKCLIETGQGPRRFDLSYGKLDETAFGAELIHGRLVVIGTALNGPALRRALSPGPVR